MNEITTDVKVCGRKRCSRRRAVVDTGAFGTIVSEKVAAEAGLNETGKSITATPVGKRSVRLREAEATVCIRGRCGCRKQKVYIAEDGSLSGDVLLGMDYLEAAKAQVDTDRKRIRCKCRGRRSTR